MRRKDLYAEGYRQLVCQWCDTETAHDTHKFWLRCRDCHRCYACSSATPCGHCTKYERACARDRDGVMQLDWLDKAIKWVQGGG